MLDERGRVEIEIEGVSYTVHFTVSRLMKLEKILGRPVSQLLPNEPSLSDLLTLIEVGIGESLPEMSRIPPNFNEIVESVVASLAFCLGADLPGSGKGKKKKPSKNS